MKYTITPKEKPPLGLMGGSVHDWDRGKDPFAREFMPPEFQDRFPKKPASSGWLAIDWCGNVIGFAKDGNVIEVDDNWRDLQHQQEMRDNELRG